MNPKKTILFLSICFLWSWSAWFYGLGFFTEGINPESIQQFIPIFFLGVYGPTISAILVSLIFGGPKEVLNLLKKLFIWKVPLSNYILTLLLPIFFVLSGIMLYALFYGSIGSFSAMAFLTIPGVLWSGLYAGPLGEELGWRGFLLPELQKQFSPLTSATLIGLIWFTWHIPLFWAPFGTLVSGEPLSLLPIFTYLLLLIGLCIIISWLVNRSKGSVLIAVLFHLSVNAGIVLLFFPELGTAFKTVHLFSVVGVLGFAAYLVRMNKMSK
jgi:membrane protease YdiL (CAAX protease family)